MSVLSCTLPVPCTNTWHIFLVCMLRLGSAICLWSLLYPYIIHCYEERCIGCVKQILSRQILGMVLICAYSKFKPLKKTLPRALRTQALTASTRQAFFQDSYYPLWHPRNTPHITHSSNRWRKLGWDVHATIWTDPYNNFDKPCNKPFQRNFGHTSACFGLA